VAKSDLVAEHIFFNILNSLLDGGHEGRFILCRLCLGAADKHINPPPKSKLEIRNLQT
jgi:hypothetical protein